MAWPEKFGFGDFILEPSRQRLRRRDGTPLELPPRQFAALRLFVERADELIGKEALMQALWPGLVVEDNNLNQLISGLRRALGDHPQSSRYIQTVSRRGFRFIAPVQALPDHEVAAAVATPAAPGDLPLRPAPLCGRDEELARLAELLGSHAVLAIVGAAGMGKTQLALAAAMAARPRFAEGAWWVDLAAVTEAAWLPQAVAGVLCMQLATDRAAPLALADALAERRLLLVLDNCEQIAEPVAKLVDTVRARAEGVSFLLTSQLPTGAAEEQLMRLGALVLPADASVEAAAASSAVRLFVQRVAAVEPAFALTADNVDAVVEICRRMDGIPLALELAAARVPLLGVEALRARLDDSLNLLRHNARMRLPRHQTLRAALAWSCELLSEDERTVLRRLAVFAGGFTLALAQRVAGDAGLDDWAVLDLLARLVDRSLVVAIAEGDAAGERRFRLLETTRAYALELLQAAGETLGVQRRHAEALLGLLMSANAARWLAVPGEDERVARELDNVRAALAWSVGTDGERALAIELHAAAMPLWLAAGLKAEGAERSARVAPWIDEQVPVPTAARFSLCLAMMGLFSARLECLQAAAHAAELFERLDDRPQRFEALIIHTGIAARRSEHEAAAESLAEAAALLEPGWPARRRAMLAFAGWVSALNARRHEEAVEHAWRELALNREAGSAIGEALALGHVGIAEINVPGREAAGEARLRAAAARLTALDKPEAAGHIGHIAYSLSLALLRRGAVDEALAQAREAYRLLRRQGEQALMRGLLPLLAVRAECFEAGAIAAGHAAAVYARAGLPSRGLYAEAVGLLQQALSADRLAQLGAQGASLDEAEVFALVLELPAALTARA